jgi:sporulation protein YhbH
MTDSFHIAQDDWSLHRKGEDDQLRHQQKIQDALRQRLPELISNEAIIVSDGKSKIRIPIRSLDEYRFQYAYDKQKKPAQASGSGTAGDTAGNGRGEDFDEVDVNIADIDALLFANLALPHLQPKQTHTLLVDDIQFQDIRKTGIQSNIDKKRTLLQAIRRQAKQMVPTDGVQILKDDLRYKTWQTTTRPESNAVILAMMDTSGSMGQFEKFCARSFFFWMTRFLRHNYQHVKIVFIAHHTEAKLVDEQHFFTRGENGGTICSSAYALANKLIDHVYPPQHYNLYPVHFSDGDNLLSDNTATLKEVHRLLERSNLFGYAEVNPYNRTSTLMQTFRTIQHPQFAHAIIKDKSQIYQALCTIFSKKTAGTN